MRLLSHIGIYAIIAIVFIAISCSPLGKITATAYPSTSTQLPSPIEFQSPTKTIESTNTLSPTNTNTIIPPKPTAAPTPFSTANPFFDYTKIGTADLDLTYCSAGGVNLKMDVFYPYLATKSWPGVLLIHGGTWKSGDKANDITVRFIEPLRQAEYLVAAINYRLAPKHQFPDQIEDVKCAIRHLREFPEMYNLDPNRIAALGFSAGGHLAALAGVTDSNQFNGIGGYSNQPSEIQAVVDISGPTNLRMFCDPTTVQEVFAAQNCDDIEKLNPANPATYVTPDDPPILIIHGNKDTAVPLEFSTYLKEYYDAANVFNVLLVVDGAGHSYDQSGNHINPEFSQITDFVLQFLWVTLQ
jgi:acetyl esterase/lipase